MDIRQQITDSIVLAIENGGIPPWRKGWVSGMPHFNASSGQGYHGINQLLLGMQPYTDARWLTYRQAEHMGLQVRKGEKGTRIVKMVEVDRNRAKAAAAQVGEILAEDDKRALVMKAYTVFNASQIDGMAPMPERQTDIQPAEAVEAIIFGLQEEAGGRLKLNFGGNQPAYYPRTDEIRIPPASQFLSIEDFQGTLLHEAAHATGHPKRLARLHMDARFGSAEYGREELVAELTAAMTLASIGLPPSPTCMQSHAAYIASWLDVLRRDKQEIFRAAAQAQKACDYLQEKALKAEERAAISGTRAKRQPVVPMPEVEPELSGGAPSAQRRMTPIL
jgi:antirestriction protein ArdC